MINCRFVGALGVVSLVVSVVLPAIVFVIVVVVVVLHTYTSHLHTPLSRAKSTALW